MNEWVKWQTNVSTILREFVIDEEVLSVYPNVAELVDQIIKLREYRDWAIRTRCGDRIELTDLRRAIDENKH